MPTVIHLAISASPGNRVSVGPVDQRDFARELQARLPLRSTTPVSACGAADPVHLVFALESEPVDLARAVSSAFEAIGITRGQFELALSEHDEADVELETPPFFEHTLTLGQRDAPPPTTVSIDLYTLDLDPDHWRVGGRGDAPGAAEAPRGIVVTEEARGELEAALRARATWPITQVVVISPPVGCGVRVLSSVEPDQVPPAPMLDRAVDAALAATPSFPPVLRRVLGAYVGTWDHTVFRHERA